MYFKKTFVGNELPKKVSLNIFWPFLLIFSKADLKDKGSKGPSNTKPVGYNSISDIELVLFDIVIRGIELFCRFSTLVHLSFAGFILSYQF
jgi:hypothetical protein